ncbi:unnamed protein product [Pleuronectes platessa]|uniref:Uncharacterized protein n=1 Tax=Pleuronectes platessa TaxID=8262 RepID=A0A9N7YQU3_PLEPL|nr:unnamed protein product [Pleuronectes platessa]
MKGTWSVKGGRAGPGCVLSGGEGSDRYERPLDTNEASALIRWTCQWGGEVTDPGNKGPNRHSGDSCRGKAHT